jgi:hypothetical protein
MQCKSLSNVSYRTEAVHPIELLKPPVILTFKLISLFACRPETLEEIEIDALCRNTVRNRFVTQPRSTLTPITLPLGRVANGQIVVCAFAHNGEISNAVEHNEG